MRPHTEGLKKTIATFEELNVLLARVQRAKEFSQDFRSKVLLMEEETVSLLRYS